VVCHQVVPAERQLTPGTLFAGHVVEELVGRGGMGVVYRARHRVLDRVAALKLIAPELLADASVQRRFAEEAATVGSITHPNIVPLHDAGETNEGVPYMFMHFVDGTDLHTLVRRAGPLPPMEAARIAAELGDALDTVHDAGFVHRDVKPRNVLIGGDGHVYLGDFGLAREMNCRSGMTGTGYWVGTADYVAPEQICGAPANRRNDVYGLGGLLFFALTGQRPYECSDDWEKLLAHVYQSPPSPSQVRPGLPRAMDSVISRALAKAPGDRFASTGDLGRAAVCAARSAPSRTARPRSLRHARSWRLRMRETSSAETPTVSSANCCS
jgi:serine/threonine protein kinase